MTLHKKVPDWDSMSLERFVFYWWFSTPLCSNNFTFPRKRLGQAQPNPPPLTPGFFRGENFFSFAWRLLTSVHHTDMPSWNSLTSARHRPGLVEPNSLGFHHWVQPLLAVATVVVAFVVIVMVTCFVCEPLLNIQHVQMLLAAASGSAIPWSPAGGWSCCFHGCLKLGIVIIVNCFLASLYSLEIRPHNSSENSRQRLRCLFGISILENKHPVCFFFHHSVFASDILTS